MMNKIHWYPGHMKKASNEMLEAVKMVDIVLELVDARAPKYTQNPFFKDVIKNKPHLFVYMKSDLADLSSIENREDVVLYSIKDKESIKRLSSKIIDANKRKREKEIKRGIKPSAPKVMVVGIPNVGKSSLINSLMNKKITKVANKPGLTRSNRWINVNDKFYLLDTPGILPSYYEDSNFVLALIGAIKTELLPIYDLSEFAYDYIINNYKYLYLKRYKKIGKDSNDSFSLIAELYGIKNDKSLTHDMARSRFLKDIRDGRLGRIYFK